MTAVALGLTLLEPTASFLSQPRVLRRHEPSRGSSSRTTGFRLKAAVALEDVMIVMNGLPGAMGLEVAAACRRRGFQLAPVALGGTPFEPLKALLEPFSAPLLGNKDRIMLWFCA